MYRSSRRRSQGRSFTVDGFQDKRLMAPLFVASLNEPFTGVNDTLHPNGYAAMDGVSS